MFERDFGLLLVGVEPPPQGQSDPWTEVWEANVLPTRTSISSVLRRVEGESRASRGRHAGKPDEYEPLPDLPDHSAPYIAM